MKIMDNRQLLRDPHIEPTDEVLAQELSAAYDTYARFAEQLPNHEITLNWRYYNDGKAWLGKGLRQWVTKRGAQKEITAFWLSVWNGFFRVTVFVPEKYRAEALALPLSGDTLALVETAKQMGKLKFFPLVFDVRDGEIFADMFTLIDFRKALK